MTFGKSEVAKVVVQPGLEHPQMSAAFFDTQWLWVVQKSAVIAAAVPVG